MAVATADWRAVSYIAEKAFPERLRKRRLINPPIIKITISDGSNGSINLATNTSATALANTKNELVKDLIHALSMRLHLGRWVGCAAG